MKRNTSLPDRMKNLRLPDKAALWILAFAAFAVLCFILLIVVKPLILKLLFLLLCIGTAAYCWIMIESRRITPRPGQASPPSSPSRDVLSAQTHDETPALIKTADVAAEGPQPGGQDGRPVFVSQKGDKFHRDEKCVGLRFADAVDTMTREKAVSLKRKPCSKCWPKTSKE